jgi:SAM-dependent methyltransferase
MPIPEPQAYDAIATKYDELMQTSPYYGNIRRLEKKSLLGLLQRTRAQTLLDVGSGTGYASLIAAEKGLSVCAVDPSKEMLRIAQTSLQPYRVTKRFIEASAEDLPDLNQTFDVIVVFGSVINHSDDWENFFRRLKAHSRPGTRVLVTVDNLLGFDSWCWGLLSALNGNKTGFFDLVKRIDAALSKSDHVNNWPLMVGSTGTKVHLRYGSWAKVARLLKGADFQAVQCCGTNFLASLSRTTLLSCEGVKDGISNHETLIGKQLRFIDEKLGKHLWRLCGNYVMEAVRV